MTTHAPASPGILIDRFGRRITYVRLSVTDRCDFRCVYCMNETMRFLPRSDVLTLEEFALLGRAFTELGVEKIRITGGEPLVRRNVIWLFRELGQLDNLRELTLTTNGSQLPELARPLVEAGVRRINISLDSLRPDLFRRLTRVGDLHQVLRGIDAAAEAGFHRIKLNAVILKNRNHDEVQDLVAFALVRNFDISFIEEMPLGQIADHQRGEAYYSSDAIRRDLRARYELIDSTESTGGPSRYYRIAGSKTRVGFISPHSHNFCEQCNRVRVTAEGRLLLCLGQEHSVDLREPLRAQPDNLDAVKQAIIAAMAIKPKGHDFSLQGAPVILRHMNATGG